MVVWCDVKDLGGGGGGGGVRLNGYEWSYSEMLTICSKDFKPFNYYFIFFPAPELFVFCIFDAPM